MPSSPFLFHSGLGVIAAISVLTLAASLLTLIASTFLLWRYRRAVARLMSAQAGEAEQRIASDAQSEAASALAPEESDSVKPNPISFPRENHFADRLYRLTISEPRRHACKYAVAGVLFALLMGLSGFFAFSQTQINYLRAAAHPLQFLFMFWTFAWPIVLTTNIVAGASRRNRWLAVSKLLCRSHSIGRAGCADAHRSVFPGGQCDSPCLVRRNSDSSGEQVESI